MKSASHDSFLEAWNATRGRAGEAPAIYGTDGRPQRSFPEIEEEARRFEHEWLAERPAGDVIAIQIGNHPAWPAILLACLRKCLVVLPLEQSISPHERDIALGVCNASALATATRGGAIQLMPLKTAARANWTGNPPALLKLTSGTTAAPRAIRFTSEQLLADCIQICETMGLTERDVNFAVIPLSHSYGFSNLMTPLLARGIPLVVSRDRMPRAVLDDLARTGATVFPGMPIFYQAFCEMEKIPPLPKLRLCLSAGAPLPLEVARKFREKFQRSIHSFYGSSECGGICYDRDARLVAAGFVGQPMEGVRLELIEPDAAASQIRVRSLAAGDGYFPEPDEEKLGHGCFTPDDLLEAGEDGYRIVGRISDVINVAGKKVNPAEVEKELLGFDGVRAAVVFGRESTLRNEEVAACVVAGDGVCEIDLLNFCRERLSGWQVPKRIFFVDEIPVNERGKVSRRALAQRFNVS
jgi:acyl-CoA synthetase (AMP-forming)/AMP-acid ligase II